MKKHLKDYVKVYEGFVDADLCKKTVEALQAATWDTHQFYDVYSDSCRSYDHELAISHDNIATKGEISKRMWFALEQYIVKDFTELHGWFSGWSGYTAVRFNKYDPTTQMKLHCDHIHSMFDGERKGVPTLTILGALNDDYEGGEFVMWEDEVIKMPAGSVVVFPSNFLYPHEVKPVKSGVRYSYVSWSW